MKANNMESMREALVQCELFLSNVSRHGHPTLNPGDKCTACAGVDELRGMVVRALSSPTSNCDASGNVAAMRDALEEIDKNTDLLDIAEDLAPDLLPSHSFVALQIRKIVRNALSASPRNCDIPYKDRVEMYDALKDWCRAKGHTMEPMLAYDAFDWLLAPAGERKGEVQ